MNDLFDMSIRRQELLSRIPVQDEHEEGRDSTLPSRRKEIPGGSVLSFQAIAS